MVDKTVDGPMNNVLEMGVNSHVGGRSTKDQHMI